eukprot:1445801-Amphidinium_carterae.2
MPPYLCVALLVEHACPGQPPKESAPTWHSLLALWNRGHIVGVSPRFIAELSQAGSLMMPNDSSQHLSTSV